jgi:hypothetical protein
MTVCKPQTPNQPPQNKGMPGSAIKARIRGFYRELSDRAGVVTTAQQAELRMQEELALLASSAVHIPTLRNHNALESWMAKALGWKSLLWQSPNLEMTTAGAVRYTLADKARVGVNLIQAAAVYKSLPEIRKVYSELKQALPEMPLWKLQELLYDQIVIGQVPRLLNTLDSPVVRDQLYARYTQHVMKLQELGVTNQSRAILERSASTISESFDVLRKLAADGGLDVRLLKNGGYFPIRAEDEVRKLLDKRTESLPLGKTPLFMDTAEHLRSTRVSNVPLAVKPDKLAKLMNMQEAELLDVLTRPGEFSKLVNEKLSPDTIDRLMESGILSQTPALSDELTEFFNETLDLPTANLAEAIILDPERAIIAYSDELKQSVRNSNLFKTILTDGFDNKWILSPSELPSKYSKDYIKLKNSKFLNDLIKSTNLTDDISELYIHKTVGEQLQSLISINTSYSDLGAIGSVVGTLQSYFGFFRKSAILATGGLPYLQRVVVQNAVSLHAATGGLNKLGIANAEVWRMYAGKGLDALDNTKPYANIAGKSYTLRELFVTSLLKRGTETVAGSMEELSLLKNDYLKKLSPESMQRFWKFADEYNKRYGSPVTGKVQTAAEFIGSLSSKTFNAFYSQLAHMNQLFDYSFRWAAIRQLALGNRKWESIDELMRYTDEYFNIQEDVGEIGRFWGSFGQPFASFAMSAPGSALRYTLAHPWRAARTAMLYSHAAQATQLTDAEMAQWQKDSYVISVYKDPTNGSYYGITPTTVDFFTSSYSWYSELGERIGRSFGLPVGSAEEQIRQKTNPAQPIFDTLQDFAQDTYLGDILPPLLGLDARTLEKYEDPNATDTLLGIPTPRWLRDVISASVPIVRSMDSKLPASIVGQRPDVDKGTGVTREPGTPSWTGNVPAYGGAKHSFKFQGSESIIPWFLQYGMGLNLSEIDPDGNMYANYSKFAEIEGELSKRINKATQTIALNKNTTEQQKLKLRAERDDMMRLRFITAYQKYLIDNLAREKGIPTATAMKRVRSMVGDRLSIPQEMDVLLFLQRYEQKYKDN